MRDPFSDDNPVARDKMQDALKALREAQIKIDDVRELLAKELEANKDCADESGCTCVHDHVFDLDCLLFAVHQTLQLYGSGIVTFLRTIDAHQQGAKLQTLQVSPELEKKLKDGTATVAEIVTALPNQIIDDGPGPDGAH